MELKVVGSTWWPLVSVFSKEINGRNVTILDQETLMGKIMITLSRRLNFNYSLSIAASWGTKDESSKDLKFDGMVGMIHNDEADLALGPFTIDIGYRYLVADPSTVIMEDSYSILSSGRRDFSKSTLGVSLLTKSFETDVWYSILLTLVIIILFSSSIYYILTKKYDETLHMNKKSFVKILIEKSFEYSGNLICQCHHSNSRYLPTILRYCWMLSSTLLILFYSSMILAHLIASNKKSIDTFLDLSNSQVMTTTIIGATSEVMIREGKTDEMKRIYSDMIKRGLHNSVLSIERVFSEGIIDEILSGKRAFVMSLSTFKSILSLWAIGKLRCGFYISKSHVNNEPKFMLYNKKFNKELKEKIDFILLEMFERKPFDWKIERYYSNYEKCLYKQTISHWKQLILFNIRGLLILCVIIITLSFIVLYIEKSIMYFDLMK